MPILAHKKHIVHIVGSLKAGGVQKYLLNVLSSPSLEDYKQSVICVFGAKGELSESFNNQDVNVYECPFPFPAKIPIPSYRLSKWIRNYLEVTFPFRLSTLLKTIDADLVHTHVTSKINLQAKGIISYTHLPWIWTIHGSYKPNGVELDHWKYALNLMKKNLGNVTFDSKYLADDFNERGLSKIVPKTKVINVGVDNSFFSKSYFDNSLIRKKLEIPKDCVLFGSIGRLVKEKAFDNLIKAAKMVNRENVLAHFVIAGEGPLHQDLIREIKELGAESYIHLLGYYDEAAEFLNNIDAFILPSRSEGFPIALLEALAIGLPCIATNVGGIEEMTGQNGAIIVLPESPEELASAIIQFISPEVRSKYKSLSTTIAKKFTAEKSVMEFKILYDHFLNPVYPI